MGILDRLRKQAASQFIEIIEWLDDSGDVLVHRFPVYNQEIKMGARLTVRENQTALFVKEGKAADLFPPGLHELSTRNVPILTTLRGWKHGFQSAFKAEVYFFSTKMCTDLKWGTSQPVMTRDRELGMIRLRAFGTYATRIDDPRVLFSTLVGTRGLTTTEEITGQLRSLILTRFSDAVAESGIAALDLAARYDELSELVRRRLEPDFGSFGLELSRFFVENISLPDEVQQAIDRRGKLGVLGDRLGQLAQMQAAEAMTIAAASPGSTAGAGVGLGAGVAIGQAMFPGMGQAMGRPMDQAGPAPGSPAGGAALDLSPRWTITLGGRNYGPYTQQALREMIRAGQIAADAMAWKPGAGGWAPIGTYPEFAGLTSPEPPPPPEPDRR